VPGGHRPEAFRSHFPVQEGGTHLACERYAGWNTLHPIGGYRTQKEATADQEMNNVANHPGGGLQAYHYRVIVLVRVHLLAAFRE
jgi:hypothetical protein